MLKHLMPALGLLFLIATGTALGYPVISTSPERIRNTYSSIYQDGYQNAAGDPFNFYQVKQPDGSWGPNFELRSLTKALTDGLTNKTTRLVGYSLVDSTPKFYGEAAGENGADLAPHTANFGGLRSYSIYFDGTAVNIDVQLELNYGGSGLDANQRIAFNSTIEQSIEAWWNGHFRISKDYGLFTFGILFDVTFDGDNGHGETFFDHTVNVLADPNGNIRSNQNTFSVKASAATLAHEFGHMLGIYDEYWAGALDPGNGCSTDNAKCFTDYTALMGTTNLAFGTGMKQSYYGDFVSWLAGQDPDPTQTYALISEPPTMVIVLLSLALLRFRNRRFKRYRTV